MAFEFVGFWGFERRLFLIRIDQYIYVYICICAYIHMYMIYTYIYIHMYIYNTYIHILSGFEATAARDRVRERPILLQIPLQIRILLHIREMARS